jgi:hypothetical protein
LPTLQGSTLLRSQEDKGGCRDNSSRNVSSNIEETLSSSGEAARYYDRKEIDKAKRPRPKTFHGAMFQKQEIRHLKSSEQATSLAKNNHVYPARKDENSRRGEEKQSVAI